MVKTSKTPSPFTAAVIQAGTVGFDTPKTLEKMADLAAKAASEKAKLAVFPEAFIGGYPKGSDFGIRLGSRTDEGRDWFKAYFESAIDCPGPEFDQIAKIARDNKIYFSAGVIERGGSTLYCSVLFFDDKGNYLGKHRKLMPTVLERCLWGQGDGSTLPVIDSPYGKMGAVICWENHMPLLRTTMYAKGVELYLAPTVDDREVWGPSMRHIAFEGRCFVLSPVQFSLRSDFPDDFITDETDPNAVLINGGSCIVDPFGEYLAEPVFGKEAIVTAEIDLGQIPRARFDFDPVGHYSRPDIFRLEVDEREKPAIHSAKLSKKGDKA